MRRKFQALHPGARAPRVLGPLSPAGRRGTSEAPAGAGTVNTAQEVPLPAAASGTMQRSGAPAPGDPRTRGPRPSGPRLAARGPPGGGGHPGPPARLAQPQPAYLLCWGSVHGACSRNGPA